MKSEKSSTKEDSCAAWGCKYEEDHNKFLQKES